MQTYNLLSSQVSGFLENMGHAMLPGSLLQLECLSCWMVWILAPILDLHAPAPRATPLFKLYNDQTFPPGI